MPERWSSREIEKVLRRHGFVLVVQRGSHMQFKREGEPTRKVTLPAVRRELPPTPLASILRQAGLTPNDLDD